MKNPFRLDPRGLAAFRISLGLMLLLDLVLRLRSLTAHYTDLGVLPRATAIAAFPDTTQFCFHLMTGTFAGQATLFFINALALIAFTVGFGTRMASIIAWLFLISLQSRNELVLHGGDHYLRILMFWSMFLPLGRVWSVDASTQRTQNYLPVFNAATVALVLQVAMVYWCAAALKTGAEWRVDGTAVLYALKVSYFSSMFGDWLAGFPNFLRWLTPSVIWLEALAPFLLFIPARGVRLFAIAIFVSFHLGIAMTMNLSTLPYVFLIPLAALWPSAPVDRLFDEPVPLFVPRFAHAMVVGFFFIYMAAWNLSVVRGESPHGWLAHTLRLEQDWGMFAPFPYRDHGWWTVTGRNAAGRTRSILNPTAPRHVYDTYRDGHWASYLILIYSKYRERLPEFAGYLCRTSDATTLDISFMHMETVAPAADRQAILRFDCPGRATASVMR